MTENETVQIGVVLAAIRNGDLDAGFEQLQDAMAARRRRLAERIFDDLEIGDIVRVKNIRPRYLNGATAKVVEKRITRITIQFPRLMDAHHDQYGKFAGKRYNFSPSAVEKVDA